MVYFVVVVVVVVVVVAWQLLFLIVQHVGPCCILLYHIRPGFIHKAT